MPRKKSSSASGMTTNADTTNATRVPGVDTLWSFSSSSIVASGSGQRLRARPSIVAMSGYIPAPADAARTACSGATGSTPTVARSDTSRACTRTMRKMTSEVASAAAAPCVTMSEKAPLRTSSATPTTTFPSRNSATVQSAASSSVIGLWPGSSSSLSAMGGDAALGYGVARQLRVGVRVVDGEVKAAALLARRRALDDELRDAGDVAQLEQVARDEVLPVVLRDLLLEQRDAARRAREARVRAHDADVVPHQAAHLVPVLRDDDRLVARGGAAHLPLGDLGPGLATVHLLERLGGAVGEDQALEQRVGGEAVGAVQPRRGALADGVEARDGGAPLEVRRHAAAHEVRRGHDGDGLLGDVDAPAQALLVDVGEALAHEGRLLVGDVEQHVLGT